MREIKFRAWHEEVKEMIPFEEFMIEWWDDEELITMQYIGVKDKNKVEIYEGDIIKLDEQASILNDRIKQVSFYEGSFIYCSGWNNDSETGELEPYNYNYAHPYCEIIGNIYEHTELKKQLK